MEKLTDNNYVARAEKVMHDLHSKIGRSGRPEPTITTSKIRGLLSGISEIYNYVLQEKDPKDLDSKIQYLKVQFVYAAGRDRPTRAFVDEAGILDLLGNIKGNKDEFILFEKYMEALVAYHKWNKGE